MVIGLEPQSFSCAWGLRVPIRRVSIAWKRCATIWLAIRKLSPVSWAAPWRRRISPIPYESCVSLNQDESSSASKLHVFTLTYLQRTKRVSQVVKVKGGTRGARIISYPSWAKRVLEIG